MSARGHVAKGRGLAPLPSRCSRFDSCGYVRFFRFAFPAFLTGFAAFPGGRQPQSHLQLAHMDITPFLRSQVPSPSARHPATVGRVSAPDSESGA
jgi:hypothetical protein